MTLPYKIAHAVRSLFAWPAAALKSAFSTLTITQSEWWRGLTATWTNPTYENLSRKAHRNPYAARGLRLIAQTLSSVPLVVEQGEDVTGDHEILQLLRRPGPRESRIGFAEKVVNHLYLGGELFVERRAAETGPGRGRARRLVLHRPDRFQQFLTLGAPNTNHAMQAPDEILARLSPETRRLSAPGDIVGYQLNDELGRLLSFTVDEMLHVRVYNPYDEQRGLPLLLAAARAVEQMEAADDWNKSLATNGGRTPGYFSPEGLPPGGQLSEEQVSRAEEIFDRRVKERRRTNLPMVLSGSFKFTESAMTMKDADFLENDRMNGRKIATVLGVPPTLLGDEKSGNLTDAGVESEMKSLYLLTVLPLLDFLLDELNVWLVPAWGPGLLLAYDKDQIEALQEDMSQKYERYLASAGRPFLSVNEARTSLGWDALGPEFDEIAAPAPPPAFGNDDDDDLDMAEDAAIQAYIVKLLSESGLSN